MKLRNAAAILLSLLFTLTGVLFGAPACQTDVKASSDTMYQRISSGTPIGSYGELIYYDDIEIDTFILSPNLPAYVSNYNCGVTAGGVTVAWYQKELPGLIPNHIAGRQVGPAWIWTGHSNTAIQNLFTDLDYAMGGHGLDGVTINEYLYGLGYYAVYTMGYGMFAAIVRENNNALTPSFKSHIKSGRLVALFLNGYNITNNTGLEHFDGFDQIYLTEYSDAHIMTAYGYKEVKYKDANGDVFREDMYVRVHNGTGSGWIRINSHCTLDAAWVTQIY